MTNGGASGDKFVYLWVDSRGRPRYVGKGSELRAMQHGGGSHNAAFDAWLNTSPTHELRISGPYSERESLLVESALISALSGTPTPLFNDAPGSGPRFRILGVPEEKAERLQMPPMTMADVAGEVGSALFVRTVSAPLSEPTTEAIAHAAEEGWRIGGFVPEWIADPASAPKVLIAVNGPTGRRLISGSFAIASDQWTDPALELKPNLWRVPLLDRTDPDAGGLQGRWLSDVRFKQPVSQHFRWVDGSGTVRPYVGPKRPT